MSERRRTAESSDIDQAELDRVADELYALRPDDFAAARDAAVRSARQAGQPALARELGKLRKPSQSAWLINLLWRDQQAVMEQLFDLAQELTQAQAAAAGAAMRELMAQRRQLETALLRRAVELGTQAGVQVSDSVAREAQTTLSAALALPEVADELRSGRLVKPASYAGFGAVGTARDASVPPRAAPIDLEAARERRRAESDRASQPPAAEHAERGATADAAAPASDDIRHQDSDAEGSRRAAAAAEDERHRQAAEEAARRAAEEQRRAEAERRLSLARRDVERASTALDDAAQAAEDARARAHDVRQQLETLRSQLTRIEHEASRADEAANVADQQRADAEAALAQAKAALQDAETGLEGPSG